MCHFIRCDFSKAENIYLISALDLVGSSTSVPGILCIYKAALAHFPNGQSATIYPHRTGENMRTASISSNSR